jgi:hypothetical protein
MNPSFRIPTAGPLLLALAILPRVTLYYFSSDPVGYVTISGRARLVDDPTEKHASDR